MKTYIVDIALRTTHRVVVASDGESKTMFEKAISLACPGNRTGLKVMGYEVTPTAETMAPIAVALGTVLGALLHLLSIAKVGPAASNTDFDCLEKDLAFLVAEGSGWNSVEQHYAAKGVARAMIDAATHCELDEVQIVEDYVNGGVLTMRGLAKPLSPDMLRTLAALNPTDPNEGESDAD